MSDLITVRVAPCPTCPYRRDVESGIWHESEYDKLRDYDGDIGDQVEAQAFGLFHCHKTPAFICAGWAGCHDMANNLAMRLNASRVDPAAWDYESPVPLFGSGAEAAEHGMRDYLAPGPGAEEKIRQLVDFAGHRIGFREEKP